MERQGQPVRLIPLLREHPPVVHDEARTWMDRALYTPFVSLPILRSNLRAMGRHPIRYGGLLLRLTAAALSSPQFLLGTLAIFPKSVHLARVLDREGIRHVHAHFGSHPATAALVIATFSPATYSVTLHAHDLFVRRYRPFLGTKLRHAAFVRVISDYNRRTIGTLFPKVALEKVHVVHVGIEPERYAREAESTGIGPVEVPWILTVAALRDYKGIPVLIDACARLQQEGFAFRVDIVGEGPMRPELERRIAEAGLEEHVHLLGARPQHEVAALLRRRPIFVLPSVILADGWMEGIPVALMEAMAAGAPVIASRLSGIPELVEDGRTGLLVEPGDPGALAAAIRRLAGDAPLAHRLAKSGREKVRAEFELAGCTRQLLALLDRHNPPAPSSPALSVAERAASGAGEARGLGIEGEHAGPDAHVVRILMPGNTSPRRIVVKQHLDRPGQSAPPRDRARHEFAVLERLSAARDGGLAVPRPLALDEAAGTVTMETCPGRPLSALLGAARGPRLGGEYEAARAAMEAAGGWLAALQARTESMAPQETTLREFRARAQEDLERSRSILPRVLHARVDARLAELVEPQGQAGRSDANGGAGMRGLDAGDALRVVGRHGDLWPGNLLVSGNEVAVIDFEGFGPGLAGEDPAYFLLQAELFFDYPLLRGRFGPLQDAFLRGYGCPEFVRQPTWQIFRLATALQVLARAAQVPVQGLAARRRVRRLRRRVQESLQ